MRKLLSVLAVAVVAGVGGCGGPTAVGQADRFTQVGVSMEPTVKAGQVITVRAVGREYHPQRGDIVLFHPDGGQWGETTKPLLRRVIGVGGETISCCNKEGQVYVNSTPLEEPYVVKDAPRGMPSGQSCGTRDFAPVQVPTGTVFVVGDNRAGSIDSRCAGPTPATSVYQER
ncbi:MAG TPA: signal peptidase I [Candidatus Limnocylindrales bacterium]|nr:signal peptidase I [Candidatus Limnocylindrales bacterium]